MDKHTPLTKLTKNKRAKPPPEERQYSKKKNQNTKKTKTPLLPAQKNKYHYNIEQKPLQKFLPRHG
jgi:hypothetical protein